MTRSVENESDSCENVLSLILFGFDFGLPLRCKVFLVFDMEANTDCLKLNSLHCLSKLLVNIKLLGEEKYSVRSNHTCGNDVWRAAGVSNQQPTQV